MSAADSSPARFIVSPEALAAERVDLDAAETCHARARRLHTGDTVVLLDGHGRSRLARVSAAARGRPVSVELREFLPDRHGEPAFALTLAVALLKAVKLDLVMEKATELGVRCVQPFTSEYSLGRPSPARVRRWRLIAASAVKQCGRTVVPEIAETVPFAEVLQEAGPEGLLFYENAAAGMRKDGAAWQQEMSQATAIVGPEGGFAPHEVAAARDAGCHVVSLGPRTLRAETAAIVAVALCQQRWGDLGANSE